MKTYTQDEVKYKIVNTNGTMIGDEYFKDICEAEKKAMFLTDINPHTNQAKFDRVFVVCVKTYATYTSYEDIGLTIMTKLSETSNICRDSKLGMIKIILNRYIE